MFTGSKPLHDYQLFIGNCERLTVILSFFFYLWSKTKGTWAGSKIQKFENVGLGATNENFYSWMPYLDCQLQFFSRE